MALNINQFAQSMVQGILDPGQPQPNTFSCRVDASSATLIPGDAVKSVDTAGKVPVVTKCTADTDDVWGFVNYNFKNSSFAANAMVEISAFEGNAMYMTASAAMARNANVAIVIASSKIVTATTNQRIVGKLLDKATADGDLVRVYINLPGATA